MTKHTKMLEVSKQNEILLTSISSKLAIDIKILSCDIIAKLCRKEHLLSLK